MTNFREHHILLISIVERAAQLQSTQPKGSQICHQIQVKASRGDRCTSRQLDTQSPLMRTRVFKVTDKLGGGLSFWPDNLTQCLQVHGVVQAIC